LQVGGTLQGTAGKEPRLDKRVRFSPKGTLTVTVRGGRRDDLPALLGLIKELAAFEHAADEVENTVELMKKQRKLFRFFVAEEGGEVVGAAVYFFAYYTWVGKSLYLDDIYVKPAFRRKRIGSMLLRRVFQVAKREGCRRLRLQVLDWNEGAISFYRRSGGSISDEWLNCDFDGSQVEEYLKTGSRWRRKRPNDPRQA
jgi:GNAT superfamily N-acetyltransferase